MKEFLKDITLEDGPLFRPSFYTTAMAYDRRERDPFPPVNVYYWGGLVLVQALLPGLETEDVGVRMEGESLIIEGAVLPLIHIWSEVRYEFYKNIFRYLLLT